MKYLSFLIILLIPVAVFLANLSFLDENYTFYQKIYGIQNIYKDFDSNSMLLDETKNLLGYFRGKNMLDQSFYSNQAILHLKDVKNLLNFAKIVSFLSLSIIFILSGYLLFKKEKNKLLKSYMVGSCLTLALSFLSIAAVFIDFSKFFISFHHLLFRNNYWLFDEGDNLIKMFPERFFTTFAIYLLANIIAVTLVIMISALILDKIYAKSRI